MRSLILLFSLALCAALATGCSDEPEPAIGDHCTANADCPDKCQSGGGFPDGICTKACDADSDCPSGWHCISKSSGICMLACADTGECTPKFGDGWVCDDEQSQAGKSDVKVCIGK